MISKNYVRIKYTEVDKALRLKSKGERERLVMERKEKVAMKRKRTEFPKRNVCLSLRVHVKLADQ